MNRTARTRPYYADVSLLSQLENTFTVWSNLDGVYSFLQQIAGEAWVEAQDNDGSHFVVIVTVPPGLYEPLAQAIRDCVTVENMLWNTEIVTL